MPFFAFEHDTNRWAVMEEREGQPPRQVTVLESEQQTREWLRIFQRSEVDERLQVDETFLRNMREAEGP